MIKDPSTSQEPPCPPKFQQNVILVKVWVKIPINVKILVNVLVKVPVKVSVKVTAILDLYPKSETKSLSRSLAKLSLFGYQSFKILSGSLSLEHG